MLLLTVSLVCACGTVEPLPGEDDKDKIENEGGNQGGDNDGSGNEGGDQGGNEGGNEGGNTGGEGSEGEGSEGEGGSGDEDVNVPGERAMIVITTASEGWCTSYPTSQRAYTIDGYEYYLLNAAIYSESNGMQFKKQTGYIANKSVFGTLVSIEVVKGGAHSGKMSLFIGDSEVPTSTEITPTETDNGYLFDCTAHNAKYFKLANNSSSVVYLSEIRITYLKSGNNPEGGSGNEGGSDDGGNTGGGEGDGNEGNEGDQGGNEGGNEGEGDQGGGSTPTPDPTPDPNPSTGGVYRSGWAELPVETDNPDYYYAHHTVTDVKNSKGENARNYTVCYSANHHCPVWVAAPRHAFWTGSAGKAGYSVDPDIPSSIQPCSGADIGNSSYNRGHMLGNSDRSRSSQMRRQVSYYTNIALQHMTQFNTGGGAWNNLENHIDTFAKSDTLYMVVGSYFDAWTDKYGNSKPVSRVDFGGRDSSVPTMFWAALLRTKESAKGKAVWNCSADELRCAAFVISHAMPKGHEPAAKDMISISELEELVGVTLFPNVPNAPKSTYKASDWGL